MPPEIQTTADRSHTLVSERFAVSYHSRHGAVTESEHVFIDAGARPPLAGAAPATLNVLEMGFGTGLNALLLRRLAAGHPATAFAYVGFERYPLELGTVEQLNYAEVLAGPQEQFLELHRAAAGQPHGLDPNFSLTVHHADWLAPTAKELLPPASQDVIFYDAFAPGSQPELWAPPALARCAHWLREGGVLVTYCARGQFKRDLRAAGFLVEALPGPPGKREMTRATLVRAN